MRWWAAAAGGMLCAAGPATGWAAQTTDATPIGTTVVILKLDTAAPLPIRAKLQERASTITIEFPLRRVIGSLPERSVVQQGVIERVTAQYDKSHVRSQRFLRSLTVVLTDPYPHRVRSEPGRIVVEIDHPTDVRSTAVEVSIGGGTVISGMRWRTISERFRAMQAALTQASPQPWSWQIASSGEEAEPAGGSAPGTSIVPPAAGAHPEASLAPRRVPASRPPAGSSPVGWLAIGMAIGIGFVGTGWWLTRRHRQPRLVAGAPVSFDGQLPTGEGLVEQLVWRAFEQESYQLLREIEVAEPPGIARIMAKDGVQAALLCVTHGTFFEKQLVEHFITIMRQAGVEQGFLAASGAFTIPAQRLAKEHQVTLIGRDQLVELLSAGATNEYVTKQLNELQARLAESDEALHRVSNELDTMRRQRNEASWYLGEERARSAQLQAQLDEQLQQIARLEVQLKEGEEQATALRRQWEESQWYLGEARAAGRHLQAQLAPLQELVKRLEAAERERSEANWYLGEERRTRETLAQELEAVQQAFHAAQERCDWLSQELDAVRSFGERRGQARTRLAKAAVVEVVGAGDGAPFTGSLRDLSDAGIGIDTACQIAGPSEVRVRLGLPGDDRPALELEARLIWQHAEAEGGPCQSGYRFVQLSDDARARLAQALAQAA